MAHTLTTGLSDLSKELGETTTNSTEARIKHYNDAVQEFANERKWNFLLKKQVLSATTTSTGRRYAIAPITDMREPGGIKEIIIGDDDDEGTWKPINYDDRNNSLYSDRNYFYWDDETDEIVLTSDPGAAGLSITVRYWHVPARIESTASVETFPIPDRYRKTISTLAAAFVQYSRYLDAQGNRLFNLYERMVGKRKMEQTERNTNHPRRLQHYLQWRGFRRRYPR